MKRLVALTLFAALPAIGAVGPASASVELSRFGLNAGGNTVAGPGIFNSVAAGRRGARVFDLDTIVAPLTCITVTNIGIELGTAVGVNAGDSPRAMIEPDNSTTVCERTLRWFVFCESDAPCRAIYRVDTFFIP